MLKLEESSYYVHFNKTEIEDSEKCMNTNHYVKTDKGTEKDKVLFELILK